MPHCRQSVVVTLNHPERAEQADPVLGDVVAEPIQFNQVGFDTADFKLVLQRFLLDDI
jgi:hypothetical protein